MLHREQTRSEELANGISHILGVLFCLIAMPFVIATAYRRDDPITVLSVIIFGIGMLLVYTSSALYHLTKDEKTKRLLNTADHISIYCLIAGTYTPLMVKYLNHDTAIVFLGAMWFIVVLGTVFKVFCAKRFEFVSTLLYLAMGWMIIFVIKPLWHTVPTAVLAWILAGGISYTFGVYFFVKGDKRYYHTIWHFFVLLGTVFHYIAIYISL
ncbi:hemolysin III family protein [Flavobacterium sp. ZT3R18]|uniref:PAQR family membrane homeostasis protein TrhA n=1 Tax=Flavobacterium sp. ZT3R18 TaxID=2594429 RepID=UPI00117BB183|nr:hemolysin III family protein [Flavobacterium sp. ZT3R18]TRX33748.1 hemolysin III family protein [Flavobacterium sp. ZT3R18]